MTCEDDGPDEHCACEVFADGEFDEKVGRGEGGAEVAYIEDAGGPGILLTYQMLQIYRQLDFMVLKEVRH